ncbi:MAG: OmpA family protein [Deltaproteobacteria bacterium]|nr:OmpA family protein [Deltaproteobacteria bacterium]
MKRVISIVAILALAAFLMSCAGATQQERGARTGAMIGAASGALLGQAIGRDTKATVLGAAIGAAAGGVAGHQIGAYMDRQEQELRSAMAQSEAASIQREQNILTATFKGDVMFDFDSSILKSGAYAELDRVAKILNNYPQTRIRVEGHTDTTGAEAYNQTLSERRAETVQSALVQRGVDPIRIEAVGFGESQPISSDSATNRRVNIVITPT